MQLTPFYVVVSFFAVAVMIPRVWCLLRSILSKVDATLSRCGLFCIELATDFFHEHVEIAHDVWHSFSICSDLVTDLQKLGSQSAIPKQKRVCFPEIDDELVDRIAQQVSDMHREYDRDPVAYQQKMFAELPATQCPEQDLTPAQGHTVSDPDEFASVSVCSMPQAQSSTLMSPDLSCIFTSHTSEEDQPDESSEVLSEMIAAQTQLSALFESVESLVSTVEQSLPYTV